MFDLGQLGLILQLDLHLAWRYWEHLDRCLLRCPGLLYSQSPPFPSVVDLLLLSIAGNCARPLYPRLDFRYMHCSVWVAHLEHGCRPSHFKCLLRHGIQAEETVLRSGRCPPSGPGDPEGEAVDRGLRPPVSIGSGRIEGNQVQRDKCKYIAPRHPNQQVGLEREVIRRSPVAFSCGQKVCRKEWERC